MSKLTNNIKTENMEWSEEVAVSSNSGIHQAFKINVHQGKGFYETGMNSTFWSKLIITAKIFHPLNGIWNITIRDKANKNAVIYENYRVMPNKEITFNYKTGLKANFLIEATWNHAKDTILSGEIRITY